MNALPPTPPAVVAAPRATVARPPAYMFVYAREFRLNTSRKVLPAGRVVIQIENIGEDDHDVAVRTAAGRQLAVTPVIPSRGRAELRLRLPAGRYTLWCRVAGHLDHGMSTTFVVKNPRRR